MSLLKAHQTNIEEMENIVIGIDQTECENKEGWWETSTGSEFGAEVKIKLLQHLTNSEVNIINSILEWAETKKMDEKRNPSFAQYHPLTISAYNQALSDLQTYLSSALKEIKTL